MPWLSLDEARGGLAPGNLEPSPGDRSALADLAALAGRGPGRTARPGVELRGDLPDPADQLRGHQITRFSGLVGWVESSRSTTPPRRNWWASKTRPTRREGSP